MAKFSQVDFEGTFWTVFDADFYVSTIGNDSSGDGSPKKPFLTVKKAFELASNGEKIITGPDQYLNTVVANSNNPGTKLPCRLATRSHINLSMGKLLIIDGVSTHTGDRILVWNQNNPAENGIYLASTGNWKRAEDFNSSDNIISGKLVPIIEGEQNGQTVFQFTNSNEIVVDTTHLIFTQTSLSN